MKEDLKTTFSEVVNSEFKLLIKPLQDEIKSTKTELKTVSANKEINDMKSKLHNVVNECEKENKITSDNLKYLINSDRNVRQYNLLVLGLPESDVLILEGNGFSSDIDIVNYLFETRSIDGNVVVTDIIRLGKLDTSENIRHQPIKLRLSEKYMVVNVLKNSHKLKGKLGDLNVYFKPDKSQSDRKEYTQLGHVKAQLLQQYPTEENQERRVTLKKGQLLLDGVESNETARHKPFFKFWNLH